MRKGFLISFEGGEGCGKSTQIKLFLEYLNLKGTEYVATREPGGTEVGEKIRDILLDKSSNLSPLTEFFLLCSSRSKLVADVVRPALEENKIVILDRFFDSSLAYQGCAGNLNMKKLQNVTEFAIGEDMHPDLTIYLDLSYETWMKRKAMDEKLKNLDRFELKGKQYHDKVREGYLKLAKQNKKRFFVIDATKTEKEIAKIIQNEFERRYNKKLLQNRK